MSNSKVRVLARGSGKNTVFGGCRVGAKVQFKRDLYGKKRWIEIEVKSAMDITAALLKDDMSVEKKFTGHSLSGVALDIVHVFRPKRIATSGPIFFKIAINALKSGPEPEPESESGSESESESGSDTVVVEVASPPQNKRKKPENTKAEAETDSDSDSDSEKDDASPPPTSKPRVSSSPPSSSSSSSPPPTLPGLGPMSRPACTGDAGCNLIDKVHVRAFTHPLLYEPIHITHSSFTHMINFGSKDNRAEATEIYDKLLNDDGTENDAPSDLFSAEEIKWIEREMPYAVCKVLDFKHFYGIKSKFAKQTGIDNVLEIFWAGRFMHRGYGMN